PAAITTFWRGVGPVQVSARERFGYRSSGGRRLPKDSDNTPRQSRFPQLPGTSVAFENRAVFRHFMRTSLA
ncbi:MAG: hypothetical protein P8Y94_16530, partial [Acidobacteriota bacterium]